MALELAFLVIDRAPQRGDEYRVLLHLALKADDGDVVKVYSSRSLGRGTRMHENSASKALDGLLKTGYLLPRNMGIRHGDYFIARELLLLIPPRERAVKKFAGQPVHLIGAKAQAGLTALLAQRRAFLIEALTGGKDTA